MDFTDDQVQFTNERTESQRLIQDCKEETIQTYSRTEAGTQISQILFQVYFSSQMGRHLRKVLKSSLSLVISFTLITLVDSENAYMLMYDGY